MHEGHVKLCLQENKPDHVIAHMGTNDLTSDNNAGSIAKSVLDLVKNHVKDHCSGIISSIIPRNGNLSTKAEEVNVLLGSMYSNADSNLIDNSRSINHKTHLNNSKLHLNLKGSDKLQCIFEKFLN